MKESYKTNSELLAEISILKQRIKKLEKSEANYKELADERQESENSYLAVFNNSIDAILLTAPDGRILAANPEACRIFGRTEEEICQTGRSGMVDHTDPHLEPAIEERARTGRFRGELTFVRKNGTKFPGEISSSMFKDRDGNLRTSIVIRDISIRKQAEEAHRTMELKYRTLHQSMMDAFANVDMNGYIIDYNEHYLSMLGYSPEEIKMLTYKDVTPEIWHQMEADIIEKQVLTRGYSGTYEKEYRRKDGTVFPVELRTTLLRDTKGAPISIWSIVRDITVRKQAEKALSKRVKELSYLYSISDLIEKTESLEDLLQNVVNQMSQGWYYPEYVCARITLEDKEFKTVNFQATDWNLSAELMACGKPIGMVEVCYLVIIPDREGGPFLKEERDLINAVAERLGRVIERKRYEEERERLISQLKEALSKIKKLSGLLPICASCKKIRDDKGYWNKIESYISNHSEAEFSHGICPDCMKKLYPEYVKQTDDKS